MEQQTKERLTGGVILVVLLVLLVPELLSGPRPAPPAAVGQPDQAPMRSYALDIGDSTRAREPVAASTAVHVATESAPATRAPPSPLPTPASALASAPAPTPVAQAPARPAPTPAPTVSMRAHAPERATDHGAPRWTVQLGTFSNRKNAARLVSGLKSHGFKAAVAEATKNGHRLFRVRVGTEPDRAAAVRLLGRLRAAGEKGGEVVPR